MRRTYVLTARVPRAGIDDFRAYRDDPRRLEALPLLERSGADLTLLDLVAVDDAQPG